MTRALGNNVPPHVPTDQCQISDQIPDLMPDELVLEPKAAVQHSIVVENDSVLERCPPSQPSGPQRLGIVTEPERAGRGDFTTKSFLGHVEGTVLPPDRLVLKVDRSGHTKSVRRRYDVG